MGQVIVRNLDDRVLAALKDRATRNGRPLERELRDILTEAARPSRAAVLDDLARCRALTPGAHATSAEDVVREIRDDE